MVTLFMTQRNPATDFGGRFAFLEALCAADPEMLACLRRHVFEPSKATWSECLDGSERTFRELVTSDMFKSRSAAEALLNWGNSFAVRDEWIYDAAIATIRGWLSPEPRYEQWRYLPQELRLREFAPKFGWWLPVACETREPVTRAEFRKRAQKQFDSELNQYFHSVEREWGTNKPHFRLHAKWAALRFLGMDYSKIAMRYRRLLGRKQEKGGDPVDTIRRAVTRFLDRIGVTSTPHRMQRGNATEGRSREARRRHDALPGE